MLQYNIYNIYILYIYMVKVEIKFENCSSEDTMENY